MKILSKKEIALQWIINGKLFSSCVEDKKEVIETIVAALQQSDDAKIQAMIEQYHHVEDEAMLLRKENGELVNLLSDIFDACANNREYAIPKYCAERLIKELVKHKAKVQG